MQRISRYTPPTMSAPRMFSLPRISAALSPGHCIVVFSALAVSLLLHLALFAMWPVFAFMGKPGVQLRASLRELSVPGPVSSVNAGAHRLAHAREDAPVAAQPENHPVAPIPEHDNQENRRAETVSGGDYIPVELLEQKPVFLRDLADYMPALADAEHGKVIVQLLISETGGIDDVIPETSELSAGATRRFLQQLGTAKLTPGTRGAKPVKSRWRMEFTFEPVSPTQH